MVQSFHLHCSGKDRKRNKFLKAWSIYRNILARGAEVEFDKDAAMDIRFGSRPVVPQTVVAPAQ